MPWFVWHRWTRARAGAGVACDMMRSRVAVIMRASLDTNSDAGVLSPIYQRLVEISQPSVLRSTGPIVPIIYIYYELVSAINNRPCTTYLGSGLSEQINIIASQMAHPLLLLLRLYNLRVSPDNIALTSSLYIRVSVQNGCTSYSVQCTLYSEQFTLYSVHSSSGKSV